MIGVEGHIRRSVARARTFWAAFLLCLATSSLWAIATPVFSVPDENAHVAKAVAQVRGDFLGRVEAGHSGRVVDLPPGYDYNHAVQCYIFVERQSADCPAKFGDGSGARTFDTWVATYNPIYYEIVGWPSCLLSGESGVRAMRLMSAVLGSILVALAAQALLARRTERWAPTAVLGLLMPIPAYFIGSVNPQGVEIAAGAAFFAVTLRLLQRRRDEGPGTPIGLWLAATLAGAFLVNARAIGPLWLLVLTALAATVVGWRWLGRLLSQRRTWPWLGGLGVASVFSLVWTLATGAAAGQASVGDVPLVGASPVTGFITMLRATDSWLVQWFGVFGWLDTILPIGAYLIPGLCLGLLVVLAAVSSRRGAWAVITTTLVCVFVPAIVQGAQISRTGLIWQGRYGVVLYLALPMIASLALSWWRHGGLDALSVRLTWFVAVGVGIFSVLSFAYTVRRFWLGIPSDGNPGIGTWMPPIHPVILIAAFTFVTGIAVVAVGLCGTRVARTADVIR
ncbi:MAG TPA: DUF2142 domain-containing protein [Candidatus Lumbricidophila sp.]|nr:DUF2142 domain-containing protein [Candidatus Lumbricidophila sp.]